MARRMTISEYNNYLRRLQREQRKAIDDYNRQVRNHNQKVQREQRKAIEDYNRKAKAHNQKVNLERKKAIDRYNKEVKSYNQRIKSNIHRLRNEIAKVNRISSPEYNTYQTSVASLNAYYEALDRKSEYGWLNDKYNYLIDLSEKETANSAEVLNNLVNPNSDQLELDLQNSTITDELLKISSDLNNRWKGALYSLSPRNPDAARHFCTSAREVITEILEIQAPDSQVISLMPSCDLTERGKPTRRSKIKYLLSRKNLSDEDFENFIDEDISNIIELFRIFNDGTHGSSGKFSLVKLNSIKKRVEDGIIFLSEIAC